MRTYHAHIASLFFSELITRSTMESTLLAAPATMSLVALSKSVNSNSLLSVCHFRRRFATNRASQIVLLSRIARAQLRIGEDPSRFGSVSLRNSLKSGDLQPVRREGMTCGGCAASVKRILESQPRVSSASVNLTTETAVVWPVSEAKVVPNWQQQLGEELAKHLTSCGFKANVRELLKEKPYLEMQKVYRNEQLLSFMVTWQLVVVNLLKEAIDVLRKPMHYG
nr:copper-transporting ATPase PAA1, chloroplastic [Ipomoea batatas]